MPSYRRRNVESSKSSASDGEMYMTDIPEIQKIQSDTMHR